MFEKIKTFDSFITKYIRKWDEFFTPDRIIIASILLMIFHSIYSLSFNYHIYRDVAGVYAWYARDFGNGVWHDIPISKVPPLNIFLGGLLVRCGIEAYKSVMLLSLLFMLLTIFPLRKLLSLFCTPKAAAYGCLLWVMAPKILRFAGTGLLESTRDFFLITAFYLLFKSWTSKSKWYNWLLLGAASAGLILARGEGIIMCFMLMIGLLIRPISDYKSIKLLWQNIIKPLLITGIVCLAILSPALLKNYKVTGYPVTDARMIGVIKLIPVVNTFFTPVQTEIQQEKDVRLLPHVRKNIPYSADNGKRAKRIVSNFIRGAYELYFFLALVGIIAMIKLHQWRKEYSFIIAYVILVSSTFIFFAVSHRYFIFAVPLFMVFTLKALEIISNFAEKHNIKYLFLCLFGLIILLQPLNAWLWMCDKSDSDELYVKDYIAAHRKNFSHIPANRKLIIHADTPLIFRSDEDRLFHYGEYVPDVKYITGFDILFVEKKKKKDVADCLARKDLRLFDDNFHSFMVFVPNRKNDNK